MPEDGQAPDPQMQVVPLVSLQEAALMAGRSNGLSTSFLPLEGMNRADEPPMPRAAAP